MSRAEYYRDRRAYIEGLWSGLKGFEDLESIRYAWSINTGNEYIRIQDSISNDIYLHVENLTKAEIFKEIARVVLQGDYDVCVPERLITEIGQKREVNALFREGAKS
jgi:hypothetical protein